MRDMETRVKRAAPSEYLVRNTSKVKNIINVIREPWKFISSLSIPELEDINVEEVQLVATYFVFDKAAAIDGSGWRYRGYSIDTFEPILIEEWDDEEWKVYISTSEKDRIYNKQLDDDVLDVIVLYYAFNRIENGSDTIINNSCYLATYNGTFIPLERLIEVYAGAAA